MKKHLLCSFIVALGLVFSMPVMAGWDDGTDTGSDTGSSTQSGDHRSDVSPDFPYAYYFDILDSTAMTVSIEGVYLPQTTSVSGLTIPGELTENGLTYYVRSIRNLSFSGQAMIEDVIIEGGTETIHQDAFRYLTKLRYLQLPYTITEIGEGAFNNCDSLENIYWDVPDYRATTNAYGPFYGAREHITMMNFGENVRAIPAYFCYGMTQLQGFESGSDSIRTVRHNAFEGCQSIYWFPFNDGLDTIEAQAFMGCSGLSQGLTLPTSLRFVGDSAFANCTGLMSVDFNGTPNIYGRSVFGGCTELATVTIPSTWSTIPDFLCENMSSLKNFSQLMDYSGATGAQTPISSIGQYAFSGCTNLETFTIPESVSTIGYRAFRSCVSLPTLTIPSAVTLIGSEAFDGCTGLKSIRSEALTPPEAYTSFTGVPKTIPVIVPSGTETAYRRADGWSEFSLIMSDDTPNGTCGDALTWLFSQADSTLYIMGSGAMYDYSATATVGSMSPWMESDIASAIYYLEMDSTVTSIGENAFNGCPNLRTMKLSSALTSIGSMAFNACPLTRVELPASLTTIGAGAFGGCSMIEEVYTYAATPPTISNATGATAVPFPDMPSTVPVYVPAQSYYTYKYRTGWSNLNIKYMSLSGTCGDNLQWVLNPNDSTFVITGTGSMIDYADDQKRPWVLYDENDMPTDYSMYVKTLSMPEGMTTIGKNAFYFFNITQLNIPSTVTTISDNAFDACSRLTHVTIPDNVTSIGSNIFSGCKLLNSVAIGSGVSSIGSSAFGNCVSLMTMTISEQNSTFDSRDNCNAVIKTSTNELVGGCNGTVIPNTVTSIASFAMSYCKSLTTITIPESVTLINGYAFNQCVALQSITSESVTPPTLKSGVFSGVPDTIPVYVPARGYSAYMANSGWTYFKNIIALPCDTEYHAIDSVTVTTSELPYVWNNKELYESVTLQDTLQTEDGCDSIVTLQLTILPGGLCGDDLAWVLEDSTLIITGTGMMYDFDNQGIWPWYDYFDEIKFISLSEGMTTIGKNAFNYLTNVSSITIPSNVTSIGDYAFAQCSSLTAINIPNSVTTIGSQAFLNCSNLNSITIGSGLSSIGALAFKGCDNLTNITVNNENTTFDSRNNCNAIIETATNTLYLGFKTTEIPSTITTIGSSAFRMRNGLTSIVIPENVTSIGRYAFESCSTLTVVTIPKEVTAIGDYAFSGCTGLESLTSLVLVPPTIGDNTFQNVEETIPVYVPARGYQAYLADSGWSYFTNIIALPCDTTFRSTEEITVAETQLPYEWHDMQFTESLITYDTLQTSDGCDSIVTLKLIVLPVERVTMSDTVCYSELPYEWRGRQLVVDGTYYDTVRTVNIGLDSIIYMNNFASYLPVEASTEEATICQGEKYEWHGRSLTEAGQYVDTVLNADGCDSICYLQLHVNPSYLFQENAVTCEGEPFEWHHRYLVDAGTYYDSLQTIHGCDSIWSLTLTVNPVYHKTEDATICQGEKYEWHGQSLTEAGRFTDTLHTVEGCDSICNLVLTVNPTFDQTAEATICEGTTYSWHGKTYTTAGIYYDSLQTIHGCDSIWTLTLTVNPAYNMTEEATICQGETYTWHDVAYTEAGRYIDTLHTVKGCDSICNLVLTVNPTFDQTAEATICEGTTYSWHGKTYTTAGIYYDSLQTIHGCDSIWTLTLTVNPAFNMTEEATICQGETYTWHDVAYTEAGRYIDTLHTVKGCDSICNLVLTVNPTFDQAAEATICDGTTYSWHGKTYTTAGIYYDSLQTIHGCDSIWTLTLTVNPAYNMTEEATICLGEKYEWHGMSLTEAGRFTDTLHTINGCDSICNLVLTVNPTFDQMAEATICEGTTYSWHGKTYTTAGIYYDSLQTIHGCDSIWTLTLTVNPAFNMTEEATICQGEKYEWHGQSLTGAGRFTDTLHTVNGCDSICNLVLTVNPTFEQTAEATICEGTTYSWHGKTYTTAGIYYDSLQTIHGCDSIWTLTLTVNPAYNMTEEATICQGETYTWHDVAYTEAGRYIDTLHTVNGCDSICNLVLTVNPTFDQAAEATICEGTTYSWHGKTYTTAGIYYDSLQTIHGCDSIWTLTLTVNPAYNMTEEATICQGEKYEWHGQSLTEAGRFTDTLHTINGCDSICNLVLSVNPTFEQVAEATICEGTTYSWHGKTYTTAGIYYDSLQTINGCDSIWTLTLTVNPAYNMTEEATICQGEKYEWHGQSLTEAGRYIDTLHTVEGCDSICNLVLTVNPTFDQTAEATICEGTTYSWHGKTYTTAGIYYDSLQTIHGCDSIWTLTLTVNPAFNMTEEATICQGEKYEWHGQSLTEAGRFTDTLHTVNGCDSICNLVLTVNPTFEQVAEATICEGTTYSWHGKTYTTAGIYYDSLQTIHGCDSILTLVLTVNETYSSTEDVAICQGEAFEWHGQTYTTAGRYQMTLEAKNGCDSICTLNLTVNATYTKQEFAYICAGETYRWHDRDYTIAGIYQDTLQTIHGCDSICTLTLTVGSITTMPEETMTVCAKELPIVWRGQSITAAGMYYDTVRNGYGCDSIYYSLQLIVNREVTITETSVICDGETITWHGRSLTKQGTYYDTLQTVHGCDSICVLNLTVNPSYYIEEIVSIREDKLPYQWQGQSITQAGTYYADYRTVNTDCDSIYTLQLMVTALPIYTVNVEADHGHVNGTGTYPEGTRIILTAVPDEGFEFQMWSDGSETNPKEFVVMQDTTFRAHFYMPEVEQEVVVDSIETHSVTITWDTVAGAVLYELRIYKNGQLVVTYEVDPDNNIIGEHHIGPDRIVARKDSTGGTSETLQVNIGGLEPGQDYTYSLDALDDDRSYVGAQSGSFTTEEEPGDGLDTLFDKQRHPGARKVLRDGQLYIELPDGTRYSPEGARLDIL